MADDGADEEDVVVRTLTFTYPHRDGEGALSSLSLFSPPPAKKKRIIPGEDRTHSLSIRSRARYPFRHRDIVGVQSKLSKRAI